MLTLEQKQQFGLAACKAGDPDYEVNDLTTSAVDTIANVLLFVDRADMDAICDTAIMHATVERTEG